MERWEGEAWDEAWGLRGKEGGAIRPLFPPNLVGFVFFFLFFTY